MHKSVASAVVEKLNSLKSANKKQKLELLRRYLRSEAFKKTVQYTLDSSKSFKVSRISMSDKPISGDIFEVLDELNEKPAATRADKERLARVASQSEDLLDVTNRILRGRLDAGVDIHTIRAVDDTIVPFYPYCRCSGFDKLSHIQFSPFALSQVKANGMFVNIIKEDDQIKFLTRNGKTLDFLGIPDKFFAGFSKLSVYMGEALMLDETKKKIMPRAQGNALLTKAIDGHISAEECERIRFELWDIIPLDEYKDGSCMIEYQNRLAMLRMNTKGVFGVRTIETREVVSMEEAEQHYKEVRARGLEGTVLKDVNAMWYDGTSPMQIKLKAEYETDVLVTGCLPGKPGGKYENKIGSLTVQSSCGMLVGDVSGLTDADRNQSPDYFIGKIITVKFNDISQRKNSPVRSFDHARFVELRHDKNEADSLGYMLLLKENKR